MSIRANLSLLFLLCCLACSKEETARQFAVDIPEEVQPYVDRFVAEATTRGKVIDWSDISLEITFQDDLADTLAAFCNDGTIVISRLFWETRSDNHREAMIFHELGHCILHREHHNAILPNDEWLSLMRGDPIPAGRSSSINYSGVRRQFYIDELFNPHISEPDWIHIKEGYDLPGGSRDTVLHLSNIGGFSRNMSLPDSNDFEIEALIDFQNSTDIVGLAWGGQQIQDQIIVHFNAAGTFVINAGFSELGVIYQRENFAILNDTVNHIGMRRRDDKYYIFVNREFVYWMDVKMPFVNRFQVVAGLGGRPIFREVYVHKLLPN
jgi:hypothetical protein